MTDVQKLTDTARALGADNTAFVAVAEIPFRREFRAACAQNACGKYGTCWMCPPDVGDIDEMIANAKSRQSAFIFQTVSRLEDSFDVEGMQLAAQKHNELLHLLAQEAQRILTDPIKLGAGACQVCARCAKNDNIPCLSPEKAVASLEAYGIDVPELAALCGMRYTNGPNTATFFGGFLFS